MAHFDKYYHVLILTGILLGYYFQLFVLMCVCCVFTYPTYKTKFKAQVCRMVAKWQ